MKMMKNMTNMKILGRQYIIESYVRFPIIGIRKYKAIDNTALQLSKDIEYVYNDLIRNTEFSMSHSEFEVLKKNIIIGNYVLSPLRFKGVNKKNLRNYLLTIENDFPDHVYFPSNTDPDIFIVIMPEKEDNLVLMGLSRLIYRLSKNGMLKYDFSFANEEEEFYSSVQQMGTVARLFNFDISQTIHFDVSQILKIVQLYFEELTFCYTLIKSFLNLPYKNSDGSLVILNRYLLAGEISKVLKNLILIYYLDIPIKKELVGFISSLEKELVEFAYSRYLSTVIISTKEDQDGLDDYIAYFLIRRFLGDTAPVICLEPGYEAIQCVNKMVVLDNDGKVFVY